MPNLAKELEARVRAKLHDALRDDTGAALTEGEVIWLCQTLGIAAPLSPEWEQALADFHIDHPG